MFNTPAKEGSFYSEEQYYTEDEDYRLQPQHKQQQQKSNSFVPHQHVHNRKTPQPALNGKYNKMESDYSRTPLNNSRNITFDHDRDGHHDYLNRTLPV